MVLVLATRWQKWKLWQTTFRQGQLGTGGLSLQEKLASGQALSLYAVSILVVFLCLAALYESWSVPFSVILVIPLGLLGAALAAWMRDLNNDVYFRWRY